MGAARGRATTLFAGAAAAAALALGAPAAASAATVIGHTGTPHVDAIMLPDDQTFVQSRTAPDDGGAAYMAPHGGVITAWSAMANAVPNRTLKLLVFRYTSGSSYNVVARDSVRTLTQANALNTFAGVRIPIAAGDYIGTYTPNGQPSGFSSGLFLGVVGELIRTANGEPGAVFTYDGSGYASNRVNVSAAIEPDADADGFGDETQDQCPSSATTQSACPAKKKRCKNAKKKGKGKAAAKQKRGCKKRKKKK